MTGLPGLLARCFGQRTELSPEQRQHLDAWRALPQTDPAIPLASSRCVVVDVEASGLNLREDTLISIGAVAVANGRIALGDSFSVVLQQEKVSHRDNILLHGIGGSAQSEGEPPVEALLRFLDYLGKDPLVAFHAAFDSIMIRRAIKRYLGFSFKHPWLDLAYLLPALNPPLARKYQSLDDWVAAFNIHIDARHEALSDALATAQLLQVAIAQSGKKWGSTFGELRDLEKAQRWVSGIS